MKQRKQPADSYERIWRAVRRIPKRRVATYGGIATLCGLHGQARLVGYAMHNLPHGFDVPWHRVINSQGQISLPKIGGHYDRQRKLLEKDGVGFIGDRIDLDRYGWPKQQFKKSTKRNN